MHTRKDYEYGVAASVGLVSAVAVIGVVGVSSYEIFSRTTTMDRLELRGQQCTGQPDSLQAKLGDITAAQAYVDAHGQLTSAVCYIGQTKEGAVWYSTGN